MTLVHSMHVNSACYFSQLLASIHTAAPCDVLFDDRHQRGDVQTQCTNRVPHARAVAPESESCS